MRIATGNGDEFFARNHIFKQRNTIRGARTDFVHHTLRPALAIGADNLSSLRQPFGRIGRKCCFRRLRCQQIRKSAGIKHRLGCAIRTNRIHGMRGITH